MSRTKWIIIQLQKYGAPHEESVLLPVFLTLVLLHRSETGTSGEIRGVIISAIFFFLCGSWLGLSWENDNAIRMAFRGYYIGVLISVGYALSTNTTHTLHDYMKFSASFTQLFGLLYYTGWMFGSVLRQSVFLTDDRKALAKARRVWTLNLLRRLIRLPPLSIDTAPVASPATPMNSPELSEKNSGFQKRESPAIRIIINPIKLSVPDLSTRSGMFRFGLKSAFSLAIYKVVVGVILYVLSAYLDQLPDVIRRVFLDKL